MGAAQRGQRIGRDRPDDGVSPLVDDEDSGRAPAMTQRGARAVDLLIAATACAAGLPLVTRNPEDFVGLDGVVEVLAV